MAEENRPSICSFLLQNHFLHPNFEMFFNYLPLTNGQIVAPKPRRYCAGVKFSSGLFWVLVFRPCGCAAGPVCFWCLQLVLFSFAPISGSFVALVLAASLQFSLFLVFVVVVDGFWFRFVNVRPVCSLFWIVCYLYQWSSYSQPSKLLLCGGDHLFQLFI